MNLENELKAALQRKEPPPGFRDRLLRATQRRRTPWQRVAAVVLLTAILGGTTAHWIEQQREGERAKEQVLLALRITSHKLNDTREQVLDHTK